MLDQLPQPLPKIDLLTVDVEGMDLKVLHSLDWTRYRPTLVIAELFAKSLEDIQSSELYRFMAEREFHLVAWYRHSLIFESRS